LSYSRDEIVTILERTLRVLMRKLSKSDSFIFISIGTAHDVVFLLSKLKRLLEDSN